MPDNKNGFINSILDGLLRLDRKHRESQDSKIHTILFVSDGGPYITDV